MNKKIKYYLLNFAVYIFDLYYTKNLETNECKYIDSSALTKGWATECKLAYLLTCSQFP